MLQLGGIHVYLYNSLHNLAFSPAWHYLGSNLEGNIKLSTSCLLFGNTIPLLGENVLKFNVYYFKILDLQEFILEMYKLQMSLG